VTVALPAYHPPPVADPADDFLCFDAGEQRELYLALALRISALNDLAAAEMPPSVRAQVRQRLAECERLARIIAERRRQA
jgi:hypothetical protein